MPTRAARNAPLLLGDPEDLVRAGDDVQLAVGVLPERQYAAHAKDVPVDPLDRLADREAETAQEAGAEIGVEVASLEVGDRAPAIDVAAGDRTAHRVIVHEHGQRQA